MKILFLTPSYWPHVGGVERHVEEVSKMLARKHQVTIITQQTQKSSPFHEQHIANIDVWRMPVSTGGKKFAIWSWLAAHISLLLQADVLHVHDVFFWLLPFLPFLFWKKIFVTFHGYEAPGPLTKKQIFWHRFAARAARGNICIGQFHCQWYGVKPDMISFGGVDTPQPTSKKHAKKHSAIFIGRLAQDTGIWQYLQAVHLLKLQGRNIHLDVYGDGELLSICQTFAHKKKLSVRFHGFAKDANKNIDAATIVFASQYLTILESLARRKNVIAYADTPIKKSYLRETPFAKWIHIAYSIADIAASAEKKAVVNAAASDWARAQTWQKLSNQYEQLWQK
jgi:glycosyltransferase involved in cell wall biosynthesis